MSDAHLHRLLLVAAATCLLLPLASCAEPARSPVIEEWGTFSLSDFGWEPPIALPVTFRVLDELDDMEPIADIEMTISTGSEGLRVWLGGDYEPTRTVITWTDELGRAQPLLFIDELPVDPESEEVEVALVLVDIGYDLMVLEVQP